MCGSSVQLIMLVAQIMTNGERNYLEDLFISLQSDCYLKENIKPAIDNFDDWKDLDYISDILREFWNEKDEEIKLDFTLALGNYIS